MSENCSDSGDRSRRRLRPSIWFEGSTCDPDVSCSKLMFVWSRDVAVGDNICRLWWAVVFGAEIVVLEGCEGEVGVYGSSEVDGDVG